MGQGRGPAARRARRQRRPGQLGRAHRLTTLLEAARQPAVPAGTRRPTAREPRRPGPATGPDAYLHPSGRTTSHAAYELHVTATARSAVYGHPGSVPAGLAAKTTADLGYSSADAAQLAGELGAALLWDAAWDGYRVLDTEAVQACNERARELQDEAGNPPGQEPPPAGTTAGEPSTEPEPGRRIRMDRSWTFDGKDHVLSPAAYQLHIAGISDSVRSDQAGFVTDAYLASSSPGAAAAVAELVSSGCWERADGGYRVLDSVMIQMGIQIVTELRQRDARIHWLRVRTEQEEVLRRTREATTAP